MITDRQFEIIDPSGSVNKYRVTKVIKKNRFNESVVNFQSVGLNYRFVYRTYGNTACIERYKTDYNKTRCHIINQDTNKELYKKIATYLEEKTK